MRRSSWLRIGMECAAIVMISSPALASSADAWFAKDQAGTLDEIASTCPSNGGTITGRDAYSVHCSFPDQGSQAVFFEATRGSNGPRHIQIDFTVAGSEKDSTHIQAVERREYQAANGNNVQVDWTGKKADAFLQYIVGEAGGKQNP